MRSDITRNKARLVCKGYDHEEGLDYGEIFSPVARMEGVRTLLAYVVYKGFKVDQMDVKSIFFEWCTRRGSLHRTTRGIC